MINLITKFENREATFQLHALASVFPWVEKTGLILANKKLTEFFCEHCIFNFGAALEFLMFINYTHFSTHLFQCYPKVGLRYVTSHIFGDFDKNLSDHNTCTQALPKTESDKN